ncbi:MAG: cytochrome b N-terminal domain-containing protein [Gemmataceae bacterium]
MKQLLGNLINWFEFRLRLSDNVLKMMRHPIPRGAAGAKGWFYVFGSASLTLFLLQIITGIALALVYVPSADQAYETLWYLNLQAELGWFIRAMHNWSASAMVVMVLIHMTQVFLFGAYKYPRELTWLAGVVLLVCTLGLAFTGQVLRWDTDAYWGLNVGMAMIGRIPYLGPYLVHLLLGGPTVGGDTLSRFFALHVFILPGLLILFLTLHLYLVLKKGISEPPKAGEGVDPKTYDAKYEEELKNGVPFFPEAFYRDGVFCALTVLAVVALSIFAGPSGPDRPPDPALIPASPRPDWYFLWLFALLALSPPKLETLIILLMPIVVGIILVALPFIGGKGERHPSRRPGAVLLVILLAAVLGVLSYLGVVAPWSPHMEAWSGDPIPPAMIEDRPPLELMGAVVFQNKQCRNCHALDGIGGQRGPDLTYVGTLLTKDELVRQVLQGGGNMPAFGKQLRPAEVEALVAFLHSRHPKGQAPAGPSVKGIPIESD